MSETRLNIEDVDELRRSAAAAQIHAQSIDRARESALGASRGAQEEAQRLLAVLRRRVAEARSALDSCDPKDPAHSHLAARLAAARQAQARGETLVCKITTAVQQLHEYSAAQATRQRRLMARLVSIHSAITDDIVKVRGILAARNATVRTVGPSTAPAAPSSGATGWIGPIDEPAKVGATGLTMVALDAVADPIDHVHGPQDFHKMTMADMTVALNLLEARVQPAIAAGATRDDMASIDIRRGTANSAVTHASVYDLFFGDDRIRLDRNRDGTYSITNGGHRVWLARQIGITELPADLGPGG